MFEKSKNKNKTKKPQSHYEPMKIAEGVAFQKKVAIF